MQLECKILEDPVSGLKPGRTVQFDTLLVDMSQKEAAIPSRRARSANIDHQSSRDARVPGVHWRPQAKI